MTFNAHSRKSLSEVMAELNTAATTDFESARPIPPAVNHSLEFHAHEQKSVFMQEWICVGRHDEIPGPGDYLTHEIAGVSVLVVRQDDTSIAAFVNACAHRYARLVPDGQGAAKRFTCRYHAWTYDTGGQLVRAPKMEMKPGFECSRHRLRKLHADTWEGYVFVSLAEAPNTDLKLVLETFRDKIIGRYDMACYRTVLREQMSWHANWKNLIENFTESLHVPVAHGKTFALHLKPIEDYVCGEDSDHYGYHYAPQAADSGLGAAHPNNDRLEGEWRRVMVDFCIFPNLLVTVMPDYLWYISVQPDGADRFQATWGLAIPPEVLADVSDADYEQWLADFKQYMIIANDEDKLLVEALHRGSASPMLPEGTYHPIERNLWQFTRYLARVCNR